MDRTDEPRRRRDAEKGAERYAPPTELNEVTGSIVDAAASVHRSLGPGLLESIYERCLTHELKGRGLSVAQQVTAPIRYKDLVIEGGLRMDLVVNDTVIIEIKSVEHLLPLHEAQLLTYLKITGKPVGLLMNFNTPRLVDGLRRMINSSASAPSSASLCLRG